jgi:hypothetical protein
MKHIPEFEDTSSIEKFVNETGTLQNSFIYNDEEFFLEDTSRKNKTFLNTNKDESIIIEIDNNTSFATHTFLY